MDQIKELRARLRAMIDAASNGEYHRPDDCKVEKRRDCHLCSEIRKARRLLRRPLRKI